MTTKYEFDLGLRHKSGMTADEFIRRYCEVFRPYAYATQDNSLNEFEKLITHVLNMLLYHKRRAELLGLPIDPRDSIRIIEEALAEVASAKTKLAGALYAARGDLPDYSAGGGVMDRYWKNSNGTWSHHKDARREWLEKEACLQDLKFHDDHDRANGFIDSATNANIAKERETAPTSAGGGE